MLRILACTHCRPLLTVPLDPVSPQFLRDLTQEVCSPASSPDSVRLSDVHKALCVLSRTLTDFRRTVCFRDPWTTKKIPATTIVFHKRPGKELDRCCVCLQPPMFRPQPLGIPFPRCRYQPRLKHHEPNQDCQSVSRTLWQQRQAMVSTCSIILRNMLSWKHIGSIRYLNRFLYSSQQPMSKIRIR